MFSIKKSPIIGSFLATLMIFSGCSAYQGNEVRVSSDTVSVSQTIAETQSDTAEEASEETSSAAVPDVPEDTLPAVSDIITDDIFSETESTAEETEPASNTGLQTEEETSVNTEKTTSKKNKKDKPTDSKKNNKKKTKEETTSQTVSGVEKDGSYTSPEDVAEYIHTFGTLPGNFITKKELKKLGWTGGDVYKYADGKSIGGDHYGNYEGILPDGSYTECDVNYSGGKRGAERLVFSDDAIYYTNDHYQTFTQLY